MRIPYVLAVTLVMASSVLCATTARADDAKKLKAVMYIGGGFHDYKEMPFVLARQIRTIANVTIDVKPIPTAEQMAAEFKDPKFGEGYDVIIYDICFGEKWKDGDYDGALMRESRRSSFTARVTPTAHRESRMRWIERSGKRLPMPNGMRSSAWTPAFTINIRRSRPRRWPRTIRS